MQYGTPTAEDGGSTPYGKLPEKESFVTRVFRPIGILVLLTLLVRIPLLSLPFDRYEGQNAYIAWRLEKQELPYRDWVDQKPPAIFWAYQAALSLPFDPVVSVHVMGMLFSAASAAALFLLACRFMARRWALAAGGLFVLLSIDPRIQGTAANTEQFMLLPLILSQLAFLSAMTEDEPLTAMQALAVGGRRILLMILAGALTGIAAAFKQVAFVNWFFLLAMYPVFTQRDRRARGTLSFAGWSALGIAGVWGLVVLYFALRGGLPDMVSNVFTHNLDYVSGAAWSSRFDNLRETLTGLAPTQAAVWILSVVGMVALFLAGRVRLFLFLAGWMITSLIGISVNGYFFPHYFQQMLPCLALAAVLGVEALFGARLWSRVPAWGRGAVASLLLVVPPAISLCPYLFVYSPQEAVRKIYPGNIFAEMPNIARRIAEMSKPDDRVFIFGAEPEALFYAQRISATRYTLLFPLYGPYGDAQQMQYATANEIAQARPAVVLDIPSFTFSLLGSEQYFTQWSRSYLQENYRAEYYLAVDRSRNVSILPSVSGKKPPLEPGQHIFGSLLVRKDG